ncbi:uncharacterized protein K452DRAFT_271838 [Aplosporella prunicola CBS 121167]|uniref:NAD(P)-binding protein n=1 Tax=Aplosporella prunicola CBS 121167 TaxID=1176127 RepID=A0A6A6BE39_9PEZI|nr:uncharacterized protein K452DRAFT_271838 [Aplosporella prunicola CBS 121167]KAF2141187.1 hypothetical protein K452DRAFT_271838 [Aplosporella prunicola CBS 121167]
MPTAVVTGANSGIGHEFAKLLIKEGYDVYATDVQVGDKLQSLACKHVHLDVSSPESIQSFAQQLSNQPVDLLLNIAGIMAPPATDLLTTVDLPALNRTFSVNAFGPLLLTQSLLPNLLASPHPRIGNMSSRVGSIADNASGGSYAYRASKAALNSISKSLAVDLRDKGVVVVVLHPGFVKTAIDPRIHEVKEAVKPEEAAAKLWRVLMSKGLEDSGRFWHREGQELPW